MKWVCDSMGEILNRHSFTSTLYLHYLTYSLDINSLDPVNMEGTAARCLYF